MIAFALLTIRNYRLPSSDCSGQSAWNRMVVWQSVGVMRRCMADENDVVDLENGGPDNNLFSTLILSAKFPQD